MLNYQHNSTYFTAFSTRRKHATFRSPSKLALEIDLVVIPFAIVHVIITEPEGLALIITEPEGLAVRGVILRDSNLAAGGGVLNPINLSHQVQVSKIRGPRNTAIQSRKKTTKSQGGKPTRPDNAFKGLAEPIAKPKSLEARRQGSEGGVECTHKVKFVHMRVRVFTLANLQRGIKFQRFQCRRPPHVVNWLIAARKGQPLEPVRPHDVFEGLVKFFAE
ncbi:unnamed protein product, partial [Ectocarpus sp. 6 AP-2014]